MKKSALRKAQTHILRALTDLQEVAINDSPEYFIFDMLDFLDDRINEIESRRADNIMHEQGKRIEEEVAAGNREYEFRKGSQLSKPICGES